MGSIVRSFFTTPFPLEVYNVLPSQAKNLFMAAHMPLVCAWTAQKVGSLPLLPIVATTIIAEAVFHFVSTDNMKRFREVHVFKWAVFLAKGFLVTWCIGRVFHEIIGREWMLPLTLNSVLEMPLGIVLISWPVAWLGPNLVSWSVKSLNYIQIAYQGVDKLEPVDPAKQIDVSWEKPALHQLYQSLTILQQVAFLATAILSKSYLTFACLSALNIYNLYKLTSCNWLSIKRTFDKVMFEYQAIFIPKKKEIGVDQDCSICLETAEKLYHICDKHAQCQTCLTSFFIQATDNFRIAYSKALSNDRVIAYVEEEILPQCPMRCKRISPNELVVKINTNLDKWLTADIHWIPYYQKGQEIQVQLYVCQAAEEKFLALSILSDGTRVCFINVEPNAVKALIEAKQQVKATIIDKAIREGKLVLLCSSDAVPVQQKIPLFQPMQFSSIQLNPLPSMLRFEPTQLPPRLPIPRIVLSPMPLPPILQYRPNNIELSRFPNLSQIAVTETSSDESDSEEFRELEKFQIGEQIQVKIEGIHEDCGLPYGHLKENVIVFSYEAALENQVIEGYIFNKGCQHQIVDEKLVKIFYLDCSTYHNNQKIEFKMCAWDQEKSVICGKIDDNSQIIVKFYPDPTIESCFSIGQKCDGFIRDIDSKYSNGEKLVLICSPENYIPDFYSSSSSYSTSDEDSTTESI